MRAILELGERVRFKDYVFTDKNYTPHFDAYKGQEFIVIEYMPDEGMEFTEHGAKPFKNPGVVHDHVGLVCCTAVVKVQGYVHDCDLEKVK